MIGLYEKLCIMIFVMKIYVNNDWKIMAFEYLNLGFYSGWMWVSKFLSKTRL